MPGEFSEDVNPRPIEQLQDVLVSQRSIVDYPVDGYYALSNAIHDRVTRTVEADISAELHDDIVHHVALRGILRRKVMNLHAAGREVIREGEMAPHYDIPLAPHGTSMAAIQERAEALSATDVLDYFMGKLESYSIFLRTGSQPDNWPEAASQGGLLGYESLDTVRRTSELVHISMHRLQSELGDSSADLALRHRAWLVETCNDLLSRRLIGIAAPLINTALLEEDEALLLDRLTDAMTSVRTVEDESEYRRLYGYVTRALRAPLSAGFVERNVQVGAPLTLGARREVIEYGNTTALVERFEENDAVQARLADGAPIALPYTHFVLRTLLDYGTPSEHEVRETQTAVDYNELDDAAKIAIEEAWRAADLERLREETLPHYRRLVLKPGELQTNALHTLSFRDGYQRRIHRYPDDHGLVTSETEPQIEGEVVAATPVMDAHLVVPYHGDYAHMTTYRDTEPNLFGPGEDRANAFWITGDPRLVVDRSGNPKYMRQGMQPGINDEARWVIIPIRYYQIEERRQTPDYDDELRFFGRQ